jgi:hypothetical protein
VIFAAITLCVASQVFIVVIIYFRPETFGYTLVCKTDTQQPIYYTTILQVICLYEQKIVFTLKALFVQL